MKRNIVVLEISLVMFLLLVNVLMGFFTKDIKYTLSFSEKLAQTLTIENVVLAFMAGLISYFVVRYINKE